MGNITGKLNMAKTAGLFDVPVDKALFRVSTLDIDHIPSKTKLKKARK